jgi:hypothetical protein
MRFRFSAAAGLAALVSACATQPGAVAASGDPGAGEAEFRALYKELVETNTTFSEGSCTLASERMKARLLAAGYPESDLHILVNPGPNRPQDGNLVAILPGSDPAKKPILLMAHIDVVEAKREDWERDPFVLTEEGGYFYARGATDDKSMSALMDRGAVSCRRCDIRCWSCCSRIGRAWSSSCSSWRPGARRRPSDRFEPRAPSSAIWSRPSTGRTAW